MPNSSKISILYIFMISIAIKTKQKLYGNKIRNNLNSLIIKTELSKMLSKIFSNNMEKLSYNISLKLFKFVRMV